MPGPSATVPSTLAHMAKQQPSKKPRDDRVNVAVPAPWHSVLRKLAAQQRQPITYALISLLIEAAGKAEIETPRPPWDEEQE